MGLVCRNQHHPSCWSLHGLNTWDAASAQRCPPMIPNAVCPRRKAVPFCPPFAFKLQKGGDRRGLLALQKNSLRVSQCYLGTDPRAGSGFGCPDLGHLSAARPGLDWASESRQQQDLFSCAWGGWEVLLMLVLIAELASLSLEHQPPRELWTSPRAHAVFLANAQTPLTFLRARSWPGLPPASAQRALGRSLATTRRGL